MEALDSLESVTIRDFRSIAGEIFIRLDAPVVLIHAANAMGKTSVMSAIELGLTAKLPTFERIDPKYLQNLTNKHADRATITLTSANPAHSAQITVSSQGISGQPLLPKKVQWFFSERCYLGQAMLSRLLEWYAPLDDGQESSLTLFVKDLLGVDRLDALIDGLRMAGHVARIRNELPRFRDVEEQVAEIETSLRSSEESLDTLHRSEAEQATSVLALFVVLTGSSDPNALAFQDRIETALRSEEDERELSRLRSQRLHLATMRDNWLSLTHSAGERNRRDLEDRAAEAQRSLALWENTHGRTLAAVIRRLESTVTNIPNPGVTDPSFAHAAATVVVKAELEQRDRRLNEADANLTRLADLNKQLIQEKRRLDQITERIGGISDTANALATVLGELLPYIKSNDCPVCSRDYAEVSPEPLANKVASHISRLAQQAGLLHTLSAERLEAERRLHRLATERDGLLSASLTPAARSSLLTTQIELSDAAEQLRDLESVVGIGTALRKAAAEADQALAVVRNRDRKGNAMRQELITIAQQIAESPPSRAETIEKSFQRLGSAVDAKIGRVEERTGLRQSFELQWKRLLDIRSDIRGREQSRSMLQARVANLRSQLQAVDDLVTDVRHLSRAALRTKGSVVKRVFTQSLNRTWRELFIRMAPDEPFVPRFTLPEVGATFRIELETLHRDGKVAGSPQTMLSTGNLNTAALALFLALNMSVQTKVPLLMLDDPVQSMDEVHTAQLAGLLRMLSKGELKRQIIIAVHERSLFNYLAFELAPSFAGDRLITVELDRTSDGVTTAENRYHEYKPETAVA